MDNARRLALAEGRVSRAEKAVQEAELEQSRARWALAAAELAVRAEQETCYGK